MELKINKLMLNNFKGIKNLEINANGDNLTIYGDNATGKTTVFDAFMWLLFNKDSLGRSDFGIKTQDENGNVIHNLEHSVECELAIDNSILTLRKVFTEKWTKKRGSADTEFSGHETKYFVNEVPTLKKDYDAKIESVVNEELFKIITNPLYFNEHLKWQDRRSILLNLCNNLTDEEILAQSEDFKPLQDELLGRTVAEYKKIIQSKQSAINDELKAIPQRISEALLAIPDNVDKVDESQKAIIEQAIADIDAEINAIKNGAGVNKFSSDLTALKYKRMEEKGKVADITELSQKLRSLTTELDNSKNELIRQNANLDTAVQMITSLTRATETLREQWREVNAKQYEGDNVCPFCKQNLPEEQIENAMQKFNAEKVAQLEDINERGKRAKSGITSQQLIVDGCKKLIADITAKIDNELTPQIDIISVEIEKTKRDFDNAQAEKVKAIEEQIANLEEQIASNKVDTSDAVIELQNKKFEEQAKLDEINKAIAGRELVERQKNRVAELEADEKRLALEYAELDVKAFIIEKFIKYKVDLLSEEINSHFKYAKFKLFDVQINGGINECCEVTYNGVPYSDLNNAARINTGLEIINTLCKLNDKYAPVIVDNAESVTNVMPTTSQMVCLVVSAEDKALRIERGI